MNRQQYISNLRKIQRYLKINTDDLYTYSFDKDAQAFIDGIYRLMEKFRDTSYDKGLWEFNKFLERYKDKEEIKGLCGSFTEAMEKNILSEHYSFSGRAKDIEGLLNHLEKAKNTLEQFNISADNISSIKRDIIVAYTGVGITLIAITIFLMRWFFNSDKWQELKNEASQGNWKRFLVVLKSCLYLGGISIPALMGICLIAEIYGLQKYLLSGLMRQYGPSVSSNYGDSYYGLVKIIRNIEDFSSTLAYSITKLIIAPMIELLHKLRKG